MSSLKRRGYADAQDRIPPNWRVVQQEQWPINNSGSGASPDMSTWRFETYGEVEEPLSLSFEEFKRLPNVTKCLDHHCIDGWSYLGQVWNGVDFKVIKEKTKPRKEAMFVLIESWGPNGGSSQRFPIDQDLLFAYGQNGSPISKAAGFPLRIVAPGEFGNRSLKWVSKVRFCVEPILDSRMQKYKDYGLYDLYREQILDKNPWTVNVAEKKKFLRGLFGQNSEARRQQKREKYFASKGLPTHKGNTPSFTQLCKISDLRENSCTLFQVEGNDILLIKSRSEVFAIEPMCTHEGTDISKGKFSAVSNTMRCPLHGAVFDTRDGSCLSGSYGIDGDNFPSLRTYKVKVESDSVFVEV
jgi:nitrite reductase/ring-hydroxylating ferredoxin subunit